MISVICGFVLQIKDRITTDRRDRNTMSHFTATALTNGRHLVEGTDINGVSGSTVVAGQDWLETKARAEHDALHEQFDAKLEAFYAPILEAAAELDAAHAPKVDGLTVVVIEEEVKGQAARSERVVRLSPGGVILRAIEEGQTDRLRWVGTDLVVVAKD